MAGRLIGVLRDATGTPGLEYQRGPEPMRGGFWAELFSFSLANPPGGWPAELVARLMPDPGTAGKETIVQRAVAAAGFPTPFVRASGGPDRGLGQAFMIMDHAAGGSALSGLDGALTPAAVQRLLREVPELLAGSMARLHALDADLVRAELEQVRGVPVTVPGLISTLAGFAAEFGRPDLVDAARWLTDHPPVPAPDVICHGDLHPFNLLANGDRMKPCSTGAMHCSRREPTTSRSPRCCSASHRCACRAGSDRSSGWPAARWPAGSSAATSGRRLPPSSPASCGGTRPPVACERSSRWPARASATRG